MIGRLIDSASTLATYILGTYIIVIRPSDCSPPWLVRNCGHIAPAMTGCIFPLRNTAKLDSLLLNGGRLNLEREGLAHIKLYSSWAVDRQSGVIRMVSRYGRVDSSAP